MLKVKAYDTIPIDFRLQGYFVSELERGGVGGGGVFQDPMGIRENLGDSIGISSKPDISYKIHRIA